MDKIFLENNLQTNRNRILSRENSELRNWVEVNRSLLALSVIGFGYNLTIISASDLSEASFYVCVATAVLLGFTVFCCFVIFILTSSIAVTQGDMAKLVNKLAEVKESGQEGTDALKYIIMWMKKEADKKIRTSGGLKWASAVAFYTSMMIIFIQTIVLNHP